MLCWSGSVVVGRAAADLVPPIQFTALRWVGALLIAAPFAWPHVRADWPAIRGRWRLVVLLSVLGIVCYNILVYRGLHATTAVNALLMQSVMPLAVLAANLALFRERTGAMQMVAIAVSIVGVLTIASAGSIEALRQLSFNPGDALVLLAVGLYAVYSSVLRRRPAVHPLSFLAALLVVGTATLAPMAVTERLSGATMAPTLPAWLAVLYAAVFASFVATLFYNRGVELIGATKAGQYVHLMPVFGTLLAVAILDETLYLYHAAGIALIGLGLLLANWRVSRPSPAA
ncbi:MAG: DMT family transporter [Gemmatimonadaceae bacterium]|nr:DMT family transporter [Acetobacteraceae bacterium]